MQSPIRAGPRVVPAEHGSGSLVLSALEALLMLRWRAVEARGGNKSVMVTLSLSLSALPRTRTKSESLWPGWIRVRTPLRLSRARTQWLSIPPQPLGPSPPTANPSTCPTSSPTTRLSTT
jgi:hypothetical protein